MKVLFLRGDDVFVDLSVDFDVFEFLLDDEGIFLWCWCNFVKIMNRRIVIINIVNMKIVRNVIVVVFKVFL